MFGPNYLYEPSKRVIYNHRDVLARFAVDKVRTQIQQNLGLEGWDILFIPGPASLAMQAVIESLLACDLDVHGDGKFACRWRDMAGLTFAAHHSYARASLFCLLETSSSAYTESVRPSAGAVVVDAVSAFPYYDIPEQADIFVTTCCKQLGAPPGISIVGVRNSSWKYIRAREVGWKFTDLRLHEAQVPTTFNPDIFAHLRRTTTTSHTQMVRRQVASVCDQLSNIIPDHMFIGERRCPVLTVLAKPFDQMFPGVSVRYSLYPDHLHGQTDRYHIFTYSHPPSDYRSFIKDLRCSQT